MPKPETYTPPVYHVGCITQSPAHELFTTPTWPEEASGRHSCVRARSETAVISGKAACPSEIRVTIQCLEEEIIYYYPLSIPAEAFQTKVAAR